jgi:multisubunit Na+/H+ antiporter MnhB subunit
LNEYEYQLLILALPGGLALVLLVTLFYLALWKERPKEEVVRDQSESPMPLGLWVRTFFPWFLILSGVGLAVYVVAYTLWMSAHPPNW